MQLSSLNTFCYFSCERTIQGLQRVMMGGERDSHIDPLNVILGND